MPVSFTSFAAGSQGCDALLKWTTGSEQNFDYFTVQASADGKSFNDIQKISAKGSATGSNYECLYKQHTGATFYRLRMTDIDGSYKFSAPLTVKTSCNTKWYSYLSEPYYWHRNS